MTTPTHPLRTAEEMLEAVCETFSGVATNKKMIASLRSRITPPKPGVTCPVCEGDGTVDPATITVRPPPDPRHEGLRERIKATLRRHVAEREWVLLQDCLAALTPAAPQPTADDVVRAVREALRGWNGADGIAERAIRACFARNS